MADANARRTKSIVTLANGVTMRGDVICGVPKFIGKRHVLSVEAEKIERQQAA
jgi:hypothetical protein